MVTVLALVLLLQDPRIGPLIEGLRSDKAEERDRAARELEAIGAPALPALKETSRDADADVSARARRLERIIGIRIKLTPALLKVAPGIAERLASGDDSTWATVFLEALPRVRTETVPPDPEVYPLDEKDVLALVIPAIRGAGDAPQRREVFNAITLRKLRSAVPALVPFLSDGDPAIRSETVYALSELGSPEANPEALKRLRHEAAAMRASGIRALVPPATAEMTRELVRLLEDSSADVRGAAAYQLSVFREKSAAPSILKLLKDESPIARTQALHALGSLEARDAVPGMEPLLRDPDYTVRREAVEECCRLGGKEVVPRILRALDDSHPQVQRSAVKALFQQNIREAIPSILPLLSAPDVSTQEIAADRLCRWGVRDATPILLRSERTRTVLNALRFPETWQALDRKKYGGPEVCTKGQIVEWIARDEDLAVIWFTPDNRVPFWFTEKGWCRRHGETSLEILTDLLRTTPWDFILESGKIRIVFKEKAQSFWTDWWAAEQKKK